MLIKGCFCCVFIRSRALNLQYEFVVKLQDTGEAKCTHAFIFDTHTKMEPSLSDSMLLATSNERNCICKHAITV